jgi:hypothetical protein
VHDASGIETTTDTGIGGITQIQKLKTASILLMDPIKNGEITRRLVRFWVRLHKGTKSGSVANFVGV